MNKEIKDRWVAALRSGKYLQGRSALLSGNRYCCLGILCNLHAQETGNEWCAGDPGGLHSYLEETGVLPSEVAQWAKLQDYNPTVKQYGERRRLSSVNDSGTSFSAIADLIESQL